MSEVSVRCEPSESDWCVEVIIGKTFCPQTVEHNKTCPHREDAWDHDFKYGTETSDMHVYFKGPRPDFAAIEDQLVGAPWYVIEYKIQTTNRRDGDTADCKYCGESITFTREDGASEWVREASEPAVCHPAPNYLHEPKEDDQ